MFDSLNDLIYIFLYVDSTSLHVFNIGRETIPECLGSAQSQNLLTDILRCVFIKYSDICIHAQRSTHQT